MKIQPAFLLFVGVLAACSSTSQPNDESRKSPDGVVEGTVTIGPMCPVVQENVPCPDQPFQGTFSVFAADGGKVTEFQTDEQGKFRVELPSGDYVLHLESPKPMRTAKDIPFKVDENKFTLLDITLDSGIR